MKAVKVLMFIIVVALATTIGQARVNPHFSSIIRQLKSTTTVPLLLPTVIPRSGSNPTYAVIESVSRSKYSILITPSPTCKGEHACTDARIMGSANRIERTGTSTKLSNGVPASYRDAVCKIYCNESTVTWKQNGYYYEVAIKAGTLRELLATANSMKSTSP